MARKERKEKFFFKAEEEKQIIQAIRDAEDKTSGEIRVHVEPKCKDDSFKRALDVFADLEMHKTKQHNGVLFYLAYDSHKFSIVADEGINKVVPEHFWEDIKDMMEEKFKNGDFLSGLTQGIALAGEQLKQFFPSQGGGDKNELTDEISEGE